MIDDNTNTRARLLAALAHMDSGSSDFDLNPGAWSDARPEGGELRPAGVLIGVEAGRVILTKRASHLRHHPGQIAFPGGKVEPGDAGPVAAALREAGEEIGLPESHAEVLGEMPEHETVTGFVITPVVALIRPGFAEVPEPGECAEIFRVPLEFLADPGNYRVEGRRWQGRRREFYVAPWGPYYIWGATARMLKALAEALTDRGTDAP